MVDLAPNSLATPKLARQASIGFSALVISDQESALAYVDGLPLDVTSTGYQSTDFLRAWLTQEASRPFFIILSAVGHGDVLLPLELDASGVAVYCGGTHANGNFPVGAANDIAALKGITREDISHLLSDLDNKPNALILERQHTIWDGVQNPFVFGSSLESPNVALSLSLDGGFTDVLERHHGKRKRKRQRNHMRKLEKLGDVAIVDHVHCPDIDATLSAFFEMKAVRFKEAGICDVFAENSVKQMFTQLFKQSCDSPVPKHVLKAVYVDGQAVSVIGCTIHRKRLTVEFGAFDEAFAAAGPGDLLFYHAIENACEKDIEVFDFGIGDEFYKRSWCDIETWHKDTAIALNARGHIRCAVKTLRSRLVRTIKGNKLVWNSVKRVRRVVGRWRNC